MTAPIITRMANDEGTSQRGGQPTYGRLTKLEFPKFSGEDVQGWLFRVNQFFLIDGIHDDAHKLMLASMHLYKEGINERFDPVNEDPMVELKNLKQVGSVQAYQDLFEALLNKVDQPKAYAISLFIRGLKEKIGLVVRMFKPSKLVDVYCLAKMQEATLVIPKNRYSHGYKCSGQIYYLEVIGYDEIIEDEDGVISEQEPVITMRVSGHVGKQVLHILVDYGSTYNFLDLQVANRLGCRMSKICLLQVSMANGQVMSSVYECKHFKWSLQGKVYETDVMILPLGVYFEGNYTICLKVNAGSYDHTIPLTPNAPPINIRPYRHPPMQKDAIELIVKELLKLKKYTIKDKFPIPVIEELMDELSRDKVFSKLDLRSGYHRIRMNEADIHKIAFKTQEGHYDFMVIPFGQCLKEKKKITVGADEQLRTTIVQHYHADAVGGHSGINVTAHKPLPIPKNVWSEISMDFIVGLPKSQRKTMIFMVVDRLSKYAHFMALSHPYTAIFVAQVFLDIIYKLHGLLNSIYWYNTNKHSSANVTPYEVVYGQTSPLHNPYMAGKSDVETIDRSLQARESAINIAKFHITRAQNRMKKYLDLKKSKREFVVGMWVYLKLQPHRQVTMRKIGVLPHCSADGLLAVEPEVILDRRIGKLNNRAATYVLVKWVTHPKKDATWELCEELMQRFPDFSNDL
ncbi:reverse transcriptase [Tanacetum coccineum]